MSEDAPTRLGRLLGALRPRIPQPEIRGHLLREEGEDVVDVVSHHWVSYILAGLYAYLGFLLMFVSLLIDVDIAWLSFLLGLVAWVRAAYLALDVHMDRFVVTNMRVFRVKGVLSQSLATMPLSRILDITVHKPLLGRILGYGHFTFESAAQEQGLRDITTVPRPDERDLTIQRVVQRAGLRGRKAG